jgi:hypothetical protein
MSRYAFRLLQSGNDIHITSISQTFKNIYNYVCDFSIGLCHNYKVVSDNSLRPVHIINTTFELKIRTHYWFCSTRFRKEINNYFKGLLVSYIVEYQEDC